MSPLEPWGTWFARGVDPRAAEGAPFNDLGLVYDAAASGLAWRWCGRNWARRGSTRGAGAAVGPPRAQPACALPLLAPGTLDRWECEAFAEWLKKSVG